MKGIEEREEKGIEEREEAEIATFTPEELREYEDSLKAYRDIKNH